MKNLSVTISSCETGARSDEFAYRITDAYITLMISLFPLFTGLDGYLYLNEKKFAFFGICTTFWAICLFGSQIQTIFLPRPKQRIITWLIAAFMAACVVSTVCSEYPRFLSLESGRCDGLFTYLLYGCILLGVSWYGKPRIRYLYLAAGCYFIICLIAAIQLLGFNALWLYPAGLNYYDPYAKEIGLFLGTLGNIDVMSAFHCLLIPLLLSASAFGKNKICILLLIPVALGSVCMLLAGVASGLFALCITVMLAVCFAVARLCLCKAKNNLPLYKLALLFFCILCLVMLYILYSAPVDDGTIYELKMVLHGKIHDDFGSGRIRIWRSAWNVFSDHLWIGVGPDCLVQYLGIRFERYSEILGDYLINCADNAHNEYLQLLCSFGLLGFLPLAAAQCLTWIKAVKCLNVSRSVKLILPAMLCYLIQAFFNIGLCIVTPLFFILWGLLMSEINSN